MLRQKESKHLKSETKRSFHFIRIFLLASILLLTSPKYLLAQYNVDSIKGLSYEEYKEYFSKSHVDTVKDLIYGNAFLEKAKKDNDTIKIADAYYMLSLIYPYEDALKYADSMIIITQNIISNDKYPALGYLNKGVIYYYLGKFQLAVEQYVIAKRFAELNQNNIYSASIQMNMGLIKNNLGENEEAVSIFKEYLNFVKNQEVPEKELKLARGMIALADSYTAIHRYDSAGEVINKGLKITLQENFTDLYSIMLNICGANLYFQKNYQNAIDSIKKAISVNDLRENISFAYLYLGKSELELKDTIKALKYFIKVDSCLNSNNLVTPELLEAYPPLIVHYKKNKDYANQLYYTNSLMKYDSIFDATKLLITKDISKKYDIPQLLSSKEELIKKLSTDKHQITRKLYFVLFFLLILVIVITHFLFKNRKSKNKSNKLPLYCTESELKEEDKTHSLDKIKSKNVNTHIDKELVQSILNKLSKFEKSRNFTNKNYNLGKLAKELKTNNTYLSKIINEHKGESFSNYIKKLRLEYAIKRLKSDTKFRTYTIQAIAEEVGFNKAQSFSTAFHKETGFYPSLFIKQLEEQEGEQNILNN